MKKKAACYIRVSTEEQTENYSMKEQTDRLTAYCKAKDWSIEKIYTDGGFSGSNLRRPALQQLIYDSMQDKINLVLVYKLDRLSRSQKETLYLIEDIFLKNNIEFVSMNENIDTTTAYGRAMIGILSAFAQLEREQIKERMTMGRAARAKEGKFHGGGYAPIGYNYVNGELIIDEYEAKQIRELFDLYNKGYSIYKIQKYLSQTYKNKYSSWKNTASVSHCLNNCTYSGKIKFDGSIYTGKQKPIISKKTYELAKSITASKQMQAEASQKIPFKASQLLTGLLVCGYCGAKFYSDHGNYTCYSKGKPSKKFILDPNCKSKKWNIEQLNTIIMEESSKLLLDINYINKISKEPVCSTKEFENQINKLTVFYAPHKTSSEKNFSNSYKTTISKIPISVLLYLGTIPEQRQLLHSLINKIELFDKEIQIHWRFP